VLHSSSIIVLLLSIVTQSDEAEDSRPLTAEGQTVGTLMVREDGSGRWHDLEDKRVQVDDILEIRMPDGSWRSGRYEWVPNEGRHEPPRLYVIGDRAAGVWLRLTGDDALRWPGSEG
jgi:hypothetical protein